MKEEGWMIDGMKRMRKINKEREKETHEREWRKEMREEDGRTTNIDTSINFPSHQCPSVWSSKGYTVYS